MKARIGVLGKGKTHVHAGLCQVPRERRRPLFHKRQYDVQALSNSCQECAMTLQQGSTSLSIPLSVDQMQSAKDAVRKIINILSEKQEYTDAKPKRWESVDVTVQSGQGICLNVFCNPNACMNAFDARVLLTVEDARSGIRVTMTDISLQEFQNALSE